MSLFAGLKTFTENVCERCCRVLWMRLRAGSGGSVGGSADGVSSGIQVEQIVDYFAMILLSSWPSADDATSADVGAVARSAGEVRLRGIAEQSATTASEVEGSCGEVGLSWPRASGNSATAAATAAVKSAWKARPPRTAKQSATTEPELVERCGRVAPSWSRANGDSAADDAAVKSVPMDREVQRHLRIRVRTRRGLGAREGGVTAKEMW